MLYGTHPMKLVDLVVLVLYDTHLMKPVDLVGLIRFRALMVLGRVGLKFPHLMKLVDNNGKRN